MGGKARGERRAVEQIDEGAGFGEFGELPNMTSRSKPGRIKKQDALARFEVPTGPSAAAA